MDKELKRLAIENAGGRVEAEPITLWKHQAALMQAPWLLPKVPYFFVVAGFGAGKTRGDAMMIVEIARRYNGQDVVCGMGTSTQTLLRKTMLADMFALLISHGVPFEWNAGSSILRIGTVQFVAIATQLPDTIYAYNFSAFLCDELDELPQEKALAVFKAIQERCRIPFPDGRMPFSVFSTTAQGYKGTYQIIEDLRAKKLPFCLIRGRTKDNLALPKEYVNRLYSIYNENERRAFLEGEFVNLTTGRVYADYDEARNRTGVKPFALEVGEIVRVGQDVNSGFSRGSAVVKRGNTLYVVMRWSFKEIAYAPQIIRAAFPQQTVEWYPDTTSREIIAGYASEIRAAGIQTRIGSVNGAIIDRVFFVNKLFALGRLMVVDVPETQPLSMALKVREYDDHGMPAKGKGPEAVDHDCDGLEYVIWRIVASDPDFKDIWRTGLQLEDALGVT